MLYKMENGLKVYLKKVEKCKTISCGVWINQGAKDEEKESKGLSHMVEHLMFKTNSKESNYTMAENMQRLKRSGAYYNGATTKDSTYFYIEGLSTDYKLFIELLSYFVVNKEKIDEKELEDEKSVVIQELESYLMSSSQILGRLEQVMWEDKYYGNLIMGDKKYINNFSKDMLDLVIENSYIPSNSAVVIVGGNDLDKLKNEVDLRFSKWKDKKRIEKVYCAKEESGVFIDDSFKGKRSTVGLGFHGCSTTSKKFQYLEILKNYFIRPEFNLMNELRNKGLIYILKGYSTAYSKAGTFGISFSSNNEYIEEIIRICINEFIRVKTYGIDSETLEILKRKRQIEVLYALESSTVQMKRIGDSVLYNYNFSLEEFINDIKEINKEKMDKIINKILITENLSAVVLGSVNIERIKCLLRI